MRVKYYLTLSGRSPVEEFLLGLSKTTAKEVADAISLLEYGQKVGMPLSRNLSSIYPGLHEPRFRDEHGQVRLVYYIKKFEAIYLVHAFRKKTQSLPKKEIQLILKRIREV